MSTRRLALVYLLTAAVAGTGIWFFAAGIDAAAKLAEYSLPPPLTLLGESPGGLLWTILAATAIAVIAWPAVLKYARKHSWVASGP